VARGARIVDDRLVTSLEQPDEAMTTRWTASTVYGDLWVDPDDDPRESDVELVDERTTC
jgi:hypothetical protein